MTDREQEIIDTYIGWRDSGADGPVDDVAARVGITRQRMYQVLRKHQVPLSVGRGARPDSDFSHEGLMAREALSVMLEQLFEARRELAAYREKFGPL